MALASLEKIWNSKLLALPRHSQKLEMALRTFFTFTITASFLISAVSAGRAITPKQAAESQQVTKSTGYKYPVPSQGAASILRPQASKPPSQVHEPPLIEVPIPKASAPAPEVISEIPPVLEAAADTEQNNTEVSPEEHHHHSPAIEAIDVACGKERMTVRVTFDQVFNGIIYAKGYYNNASCQFVAPNSGESRYQFDLTTGECGVAFIDSGLTDGGQAYVEGILVVISEPGVQEAWDAARKIRCLWEGNLEQTVTFPLGVNMLDSKVLTFSGDTATVALEIQSGAGPRAPVVQGLVAIGDRLTAVVTVQGDTEFDLLVRNCVATDGSADNRITLSDTRGCAVKEKLMGGWTKEKSNTSVLAFAEMNAFKFPDVMDLFLECTVTLCKGACEECPNYLTLHVPNHEHDTLNSTDIITSSITTEESPATTDIPVSSRVRRHAPQFNDQTIPEELKLRKVVHVVGPDDLPDWNSGVSGATVYGSPNGTCPTQCISLLGIVTAVALTLLLCLTCLVIYGTFRRKQMKY